MTFDELKKVARREEDEGREVGRKEGGHVVRRR